MPTDTITLEQSSVEQDTREAEVTPPGQVAVDQVLAAVLSDSRNDPQTFLDETVVPHGGE